MGLLGLVNVQGARAKRGSGVRGAFCLLVVGLLGAAAGCENESMPGNGLNPLVPSQTSGPSADPFPQDPTPVGPSGPTQPVDSPVTGPQVSGALDGFYTGRRYKYEYVSLRNQYEYRLYLANLFFLPGGEVYWATGTDIGLLDTFDAETALQNEPKRGGRWRVEGSTLTMDWNDGSTWTAEVNGKSLTLDSAGTFSGVTINQPMQPAATLEGTYYSTSSTSVTESASVDSDHWITFGTDGSIELKDSLNLANLLGQEETARGSYSIRGYTLETRTGAGDVSFNIWVPEGDPADPKLIVVNGRGYLRR